MSVGVLVLPTGFGGKLRINDCHDPEGSLVFTIENTQGQAIIAVIDRAQYHMLSLYLAERLAR